MGQDIDRSNFSEEDFKAFSAKLHHNLAALKEALARPGFSCDAPTLGAELEYYLVDHNGLPLCANRAVQTAIADPRVTLELNQYNLEYNFDPLPLSGRPFSQLEDKIVTTAADMNRHASAHGGELMSIGILPTLGEQHLGPEIMTSIPRYQALSEILLALRGGEFTIDIEGRDQIHTRRSDLTLEGACTSFQIHYNFPIEQFVPIWNAMTLVTPLVLALATNSPLLLGKRLWHETRVPLFKQSTDSRTETMPWHDLPRVELGYDWLRSTPYELFAQRVYLYPPLIPLCHPEDPHARVARDELPELHELNLHNGTIWHWNRPVYCATGNGHIRIEMRSLPAGPTAVDMAANAAFYIGLATGLAEEIEALLPAIPFRFVSENFYAAARDGINARLIWPSLTQNRLRNVAAGELALRLLSTADRGLEQLGILPDERKRLLKVIEERAERRQTGSVWLLRGYEALMTNRSASRALTELVLQYRTHSNANRPVSDWEPAG
jgi:gamma-glutamyl:cysteine ligase YbdK (ATP-grasp superfamily)